MNVINRLFRFIIFSSLFIAMCSVLMVYQTQYLFNIPGPGISFYLFVFFSTVCSYNLHWFLTSHSVKPSQRIQWAQKYKHIHLVLFLVGLLGSGIFFFALIQHWYWLLLGAFITFLYTAPKLPHKHFIELKKIAIGKTIFLSMVWTYVTTALPLLVTFSNFTTDAWLFIISRFFLIYAICILFDYRDRLDDKMDGIRSLITYLEEKGIDKLFYFSLILFAIATIMMYFYDHSLVFIIILLIPGFLTALLYTYAKKNDSDIFYYFVLDGLMMLSALIMLLMSF